MTSTFCARSTMFRARSTTAVIILALCWLASTSCHDGKSDQPAPRPGVQSPLWGALSPGPYSVGYRTLFRFDPTRTWRLTRTSGQGFFSPDKTARPVRISVWYPAASASKPMRFADFLRLPAPPDFAEADAALARRDRRILSTMVPPESFSKLLETTTSATADAAAAPGRFPLILYSAGINAYTLSGAVMAEFLASHGYVVVAVPSLGPTDHQPDQVYSPSQMEASIRDLEFAWAEVRTRPNVDDGKLGIFGHSLGGTVAMILAMRNANVMAAVGLDGTYGFPEGKATLTEFHGYEPRKMWAAILDIHRSDYTTLDASALETWRHSDRHVVTLAKILHPDFTTFAAIKQVFGVPPPSYVTSESGYTTGVGHERFQLTARIVRDFFDAKLRADPGALKRLTSELAQTAGTTVSHEAPQPVPPSARELAALIADKGLDAAKLVVDRFRAQVPEIAVIDEAELNRFGYNLIADKQFAEAVGILRLVTHVYPASWNAADSLGDAYAAAGNDAESRAAYQRSLQLITADRTVDNARRDSVVRDLRAKIEGTSPR